MAATQRGQAGTRNRAAPGRQRVLPDESFCAVAKRAGRGSSNTDKDAKPVTTLMFKNIPRKCTPKMLSAEIEAHADDAEMDFVYLPWSLSTKSNYGYAFVNFVASEAAVLVWQAMDRKLYPWASPTSRQIRIVAADHQGLAENLRHCAFKIAIDGDPELRPLVWRNGSPIDFGVAVRLFGKRPSAKRQQRSKRQQQVQAIEQPEPRQQPLHMGEHVANRHIPTMFQEEPMHLNHVANSHVETFQEDFGEPPSLRQQPKYYVKEFGLRSQCPQTMQETSVGAPRETNLLTRRQQVNHLQAELCTAEMLELLVTHTLCSESSERAPALAETLKVCPMPQPDVTDKARAAHHASAPPFSCPGAMQADGGEELRMHSGQTFTPSRRHATRSVPMPLNSDPGLSLSFAGLGWPPSAPGLPASDAATRGFQAEPKSDPGTFGKQFQPPPLSSSTSASFSWSSGAASASGSSFAGAAATFPGDMRDLWQDDEDCYNKGKGAQDGPEAAKGGADAAGYLQRTQAYRASSADVTMMLRKLLKEDFF